MWAITTVQWVRDHAGVVIVSGFLGAAPAGAYFAADRTANLLAFLLLAINLVSAPPISRYFHSDRMDLVRVIVGASGLFAGFAALSGLIFFFIFGGKILALFNPVYESFLPVLLILCCGQFFIAATGPVGILLNLSGHQRISLILGISVGSVSVALQAVGAFYYGPIGVASAAAAGTVFSNLASAIYAWRVLGIDSSGLSLAFQMLRKHGRTPLRNLLPPR
jgi:O-antigen/teichoic acid export membrane protein